MRLILFLLTLCLFVSMTAFSQVNGNYNYAIAFKGFTIMQLPKIFNQDEQKFVIGGLNSGMIKFNDNQINYRVSGSYLNQSLSFGNDCTNCDVPNGKVKDYTFKLGFEKNMNYALIQPYFALDMGYRFNQFQGMMNSINNKRNIAAVNALEDTKTGITVGPVIGFKINPTSRISFFAEGSIEFYYAYVRQTTILQDDSGFKTQNKFNRGEFLLNPVSVGIQLHFGNKN